MNNTSSISLSGLAREAIVSLRGQRIAVILVASLVAMITATVLITTSRARAANDQVTARVEAAGSLTLIITDPTNPDLVSGAVIAALQGVTGIEGVLGIGPARDVTNALVGSGAQPSVAWPVTGDLSRAVVLTAGRWPRDGEAIVAREAQTALGLDAPIGTILDEEAQRPIVGAYVPRPGFEALDGVLIVRADAAAPAVQILLASATYATAIQRLAISAIRPTNESTLQVISPTALAELQQSVNNDLGHYARLLTALTVSAGAVLIAIVVLGEILLQRRDIGRRRVLGAPRWVVTTLVVIQVATPATVGALLGGTIGLAASIRSGAPLSLPLAAASLIVGVLVAAVASLPPALIAAWRDPVRVLRMA